MSRSTLLLIAALNWSVLFAQSPPDPVIEVNKSGGHAQLILRNVHNVPIQAYLIDITEGYGATRLWLGTFDRLGSNPIAPNATMDVSPWWFPPRCASQWSTLMALLRGTRRFCASCLQMRAKICQSIPFAERALRQAGACEQTLPELIRVVAGWRRDPGYLLFAELSREGRSQRPSGGAQVGMYRVDQQIVETLRKGSVAESVPEAIERVVRMLRAIEGTLSRDPSDM